MALSLTSGGIVFPATQVDTDEANTFDDYEEGTFTPLHNFQNGTQESNKTFTVQSALYVKIAQTCFIESYIAGGYSGGNQDNVSSLIPFAHSALIEGASAGGPSMIITGNGQNFNGTLVYINDGNALYTLGGLKGTGNYTQSMPTTYTAYINMTYRTTT